MTHFLVQKSAHNNNNNNNNNNNDDDDDNKVVPIVVGALGAVTPNLSKHLDAIGVTTRIELSQKAALLNTARLLRRVLEASGYET